MTYIFLTKELNGESEGNSILTGVELLHFGPVKLRYPMLHLVKKTECCCSTSYLFFIAGLRFKNFAKKFILLISLITSVQRTEYFHSPAGIALLLICLP